MDEIMDEMIKLEKYTLTYKHSVLLGDGTEIEDEPRTRKLLDFDSDECQCPGRKEHLLDELFNKMLRELKDQL